MEVVAIEESLMKKARSYVILCACFIITFCWKERAFCRQVRKRTIPAKQDHKFQSVMSVPFGQQSLRNQDTQLQYRRRVERSLSLSTNCNNWTPVVSFVLSENKGGNGGFGDRLLGMVTTFYLALMTEASLEIKWTRPYHLSDYFIVLSCDKHRKPQESRNGIATFSAELPSSGETVRNAIGNWTYFTESLFLNDIGKSFELRTNSFHWTDIVRHKDLRTRAKSLGLSNFTQAQLFKLAIDRLLGNPTNVLKDSYASVLRLLAGRDELKAVPYVGVQIRIGGTSGGVAGWHDLSRHSLKQVPCFATEAVRLCLRNDIRSIFVTADSDEAVRVFKDAVYKKFQATGSSFPPPLVVQVPGDIVHTDLSDVNSEHAKDLWLKSVLDWWVLKQAKALVVSRSGFGETAALASDAEVALRLKMCPAEKTTPKAQEDSTCEFEDILDQETDIFKRLYESWDQLKGCL